MPVSAMTAAAKRVLSAWRNPLVPPPTLEHLGAIRSHEIETVVALIGCGEGRLLEIGAGAGWQSRALSEHGFQVDAIDLASSHYAQHRVWPVIEYDGTSIPFPAATFDVVFSSSTLEHIPHLRDFQQEIRRVLKANGIAVHVVPSAAWRFWTSLTHPIRYLTPPIVHGEHAPNVFAEMLGFRRSAWTRLFTETGWRVLRYRRGGLFYTGCCIADHRLSMHWREQLSGWLGSSVHVFALGTEQDSNERRD